VVWPGRTRAERRTSENAYENEALWRGAVMADTVGAAV
jgi:hypothetical protein